MDVQPIVRDSDLTGTGSTSGQAVRERGSLYSLDERILRSKQLSVITGFICRFLSETRLHGCDVKLGKDEPAAECV